MHSVLFGRREMITSSSFDPLLGRKSETEVFAG